MEVMLVDSQEKLLKTLKIMKIHRSLTININSTLMFKSSYLPMTLKLMLVDSQDLLLLLRLCAVQECAKVADVKKLQKMIPTTSHPATQLRPPPGREVWG